MSRSSSFSLSGTTAAFSVQNVASDGRLGVNMIANDTHTRVCVCVCVNLCVYVYVHACVRACACMCMCVHRVWCSCVRGELRGNGKAKCENIIDNVCDALFRLRSWRIQRSELASIARCSDKSSQSHVVALIIVFPRSLCFSRFLLLQQRSLEATHVPRKFFYAL